MNEFVRIYQSNILFQVEIIKGKLTSEGIESYIKNEFVNNLAVMPINQDYILYVAEKDALEAERIIRETSAEEN
ncbi:putative signal transducing protein [Elizabethkingia meningoseptica]|uniref:putative signal transducing protein n=1 Tax=Elizabethkingia meningoseptica TaxID=238 RepID=UPI0038911AE2